MNVTRFSSIDIVRGIAVTFMILSDLPTIISMGILILIANRLATPFFLVISGLSYELFISSRLERGISSSKISLESFWRAILLLLIVMIPLYFGSLFYPNKFQFEFHWSIFQIIAVGYLIGIILKRNLKLEIFSIFLIFLLTFILNTYFFDYFKFFLTGEMPPFPYLAYFIFGRVISEIYLSKDKILDDNLLITISCISSLLIFVFTILLLKLDFFKLNRGDLAIFTLLCSTIFLAVILLNYIIDKKKIKIPFFEHFERIGKIAFSSYYIFYILELAIFPFINRHFLNNFNSVLLLLFYICSYILIVLLLSFVERIWSKYNYAFGVEWLLRNGVKKIMNFF
jgi:hypothetical protein